MTRITLGGSALAGFAIPEPAASVRVLLPSPGSAQLVLPAWNGNEFLLADGRRPVIRTFTPRRFNDERLELDVEIVLHGSGAASEWADRAQPGDGVAISGPGRGYTIDAAAPSFLLGGDETAMPAIAQLLEVLPAVATVDVHIEVAAADAAPGVARASTRHRCLARPRDRRTAGRRARHRIPGRRGSRRCTSMGGGRSRGRTTHPAPPLRRTRPGTRRRRSAATGRSAAAATPMESEAWTTGGRRRAGALLRQ